MTDRLPPNLLKLFAPRPPMPYIAPLDRDEDERTGPIISGLANFLQYVEEEKEREYQPTETLEQRRARKKKEQEDKCKETIEKRTENWKPNENLEATGDPFKTLIVARLAYDVSESDLRKEMEYYGPLKRIRMIKNTLTDKPRGYAFVEFEREKDMKAAYHEADGVRLRGKRIMVDVERGRTVKEFKPRSLGGGLGYTRKGRKEENQRHSGREIGRVKEQESSSRHRDSSKHDYRERERERRRRSRSPVSRGRDRDYERYRERYHDRDSSYRHQGPRDYDRPQNFGGYGYFSRRNEP